MDGAVTDLDMWGEAPPTQLLQAPLRQPQPGQQQQQVEGPTTQRATTRSVSRALRAQAAARTAQQQQGPLERLVQGMPQLTALRGLALPAATSTGRVGGGSSQCAGLPRELLQQLRALGVLVDHCDVSDLRQLQLLPQLSQLQVRPSPDSTERVLTTVLCVRIGSTYLVVSIGSRPVGLPDHGWLPSTQLRGMATNTVSSGPLLLQSSTHVWMDVCRRPQGLTELTILAKHDDDHFPRWVCMYSGQGLA